MSFLRIVATFAVALAFISAPRLATAGQSSGAMLTVQTFVDDFNKGDVKAALALCAPQTQIIDEFPPHQWTSCAAWANAFDAYSKAKGDTDQVVTLGTPWHVDVTGDIAYVVVPTTYTIKEKGTTITEHGSVLTVRLKKSANGWLVTAWTWSKH